MQLLHMCEMTFTLTTNRMLSTMSHIPHSQAIACFVVAKSVYWSG